MTTAINSMYTAMVSSEANTSIMSAVTAGYAHTNSTLGTGSGNTAMNNSLATMYLSQIPVDCEIENI